MRLAAVAGYLATFAAGGAARGLAAAAQSSYSLSVLKYPAKPALDWLAEPRTSMYEFAYNPAYLPPSPHGDSPEGLFVRVQNGSASPPGICGQPNPTSYVAFAPISAAGTIGPLSAQGGPLFGPANTSWEQTAEDPRVIYHEATEQWYMTYTANGLVDPEDPSKRPPLNRHQGIATSKEPHKHGSWERRCDAANPCLPPGYKSGAMLARATPPHYMFVYDLRLDCPTPKGCRNTVLATSHDLIHWKIEDPGTALLPRRMGMWDAGLIEPGPPALILGDGNILFFYNGATLPNDRQYHVGWAVLDKDDPSKVLQRSDTPLLSWSDRPWMVGNDSHYLCYTPTVVFCNGARALSSNTFELFFGAADAVVGSATVQVDLEA